METVALLIIGVVIAFVATTRWGTPPVMLGLVLVSLSGFQFILAGSAEPNAGIADASPQLYAHGLLLLIAFAGLVLTGGLRALPPMLWVFLLLLYIGWALVWPHNAASASGVLHLTTGVAAWAVGTAIGRRFSLRDGRNAHWLAVLLLALALFQAFSVLLQYLGVHLTVLGLDLGNQRIPDRFNGAFAHPGTLGKYAVLLLLPLLPLTRVARPSTRRVAFVTLGVLLLVLATTQGRANFLAALSAIIVWIAIAPGSRLTGRLQLFVTMAAIGLPFAGVYAARFASDPDGGDRPGLLAAGLRQITSNPILGIGPNNYVDVVGRWSPETAAGFPVHNSFLLAAAEFGIPVAIIFFAGVLSVLVVALRKIAARRASLMAYSLASVTPGILLIAYTGWGMLSGTMFYLWMFLFAFAASQLTSAPSEDAEETTGSGSRARSVDLPAARAPSRSVHR